MLCHSSHSAVLWKGWGKENPSKCQQPNKILWDALCASKRISEKEVIHWILAFLFFNASSSLHELCLLLGFLCPLINGYSQHILELTCFSSAKEILYHKLCRKSREPLFMPVLASLFLYEKPKPSFWLTGIITLVISLYLYSLFILRETEKQRNKTSSVFSLQILRQDLLKPYPLLGSMVSVNSQVPKYEIKEIKCEIGRTVLYEQ